MRCGLGVLTAFENDLKESFKFSYEGIFENGQPHGKGIYLDMKNKKRVDGIWSNGALTSILQIRQI